MKFSLLTSLIVLTTFFSKAAVIVVDNNTNSPATYSSAQNAHDFASSGDTLLITASPNSYGTLTVRKKLVIWGEGTLPNEQRNNSVEFSTLRLDKQSGTTQDADSTILRGLDISSLQIYPGVTNEGIKDIDVQRCRITIVYFYDNDHKDCYFRDCAIQTFGNNTSYGMIDGVIENCIINKINVGTSSSQNAIFQNCLIGAYVAGANLIVTNSILYDPSKAFFNNNANGTYTNCLFYFSSPVSISNGSGNVLNQDPMFVVPTQINVLDVITYTYGGTVPDYNLQSNSPASGLGTDGTDAGIYGGQLPFTEGTGLGRYRYLPMPSEIPYVIDMDILNPSVQPNGTLNVDINARTQD